MSNLQQPELHFVVVSRDFSRMMAPVKPAVLPGEYALREPLKVSVEFLPLPSEAEISCDDVERTNREVDLRLAREFDDLDEFSDASGRYYTAFNRSMGGIGFSKVLGVMWEQWVAKVRRAPSRSVASRAAMMRVWRSRESRRARSYILVEGLLVSARQLAKDFCLATLRELSARNRDLASKRALARAVHMRVRPSLGLTAETGSAAAIAGRMNPIGAPPHLV